MDTREEFAALLADFTRESGLTSVGTTPESAVFEIGAVSANLQLLPESGSVLAWATLGFLGDDANAPKRLVYLMQANDYLSETGGFSFALDEDDHNRALVQDIRPLAFLDSADRLAAWLETLVKVVEAVRVNIAAACPYADDEPLESPEPKIEEV